MAETIEIKKKTIKWIFLVVILLIFFSFRIYTDYESKSNYDNQNSDSSPEKFLENDSFGISEIHFEHMPINYFLDINTKKANDKYEEEVVRLALRIIENSTENLVQFKEVQNYENADLVIYGKPPEKNSDDRFISEGFAGPREISGNKIKKAEVILYASKHSFYSQDKSFL